MSQNRHQGPSPVPGRPTLSPDFVRVLGRVAVPLLVIDLALILITTAAVLLEMAGHVGDVPDRLMITRDWSYGETFNYLKWAAVAGLCAAAWRAARDPMLLGFAAAFAVLLLDDMLQLHERWGAAAAARFGIEARLGLRPQDFGELLVWGLLGLAVVAVLVAGFRHARPANLGAGLALLATLAGLVLCGVGLDMLAVAVRGAMPAGTVETVLVWALHLGEDGGEMALASLAVAVAAAAWTQAFAQRRHRAPAGAALPTAGRGRPRAAPAGAQRPTAR
jgi:hypothetical protein